MFYKYLMVMIGAILFVHSSSGHTNQNKTDTNRSNSLTTNLKSKESNVTMYLIINSNHSLLSNDTMLRARPEIITSLLYKEFDNDGKVMNEFMMYNLGDVAKFFKNYLDVKLCDGECD